MAGQSPKTGYWDSEIAKDTATRAETEAFYADAKNVEVVSRTEKPRHNLYPFQKYCTPQIEFQYNEDQAKSGSVGQDYVAKKLLDLGVDKSAKILDVCGGTGRVARRVQFH